MSRFSWLHLVVSVTILHILQDFAHGWKLCDESYQCAYNNYINSSISCYGYQSCYGSDLESVWSSTYCPGYEGCAWSVVDSSSSVYCDGAHSCYAADVTTSKNMYCLGHESCEYADVLNADCTYCNGDFACERADIVSKYVFGYGYYALYRADVYSEGFTLYVYLDGYMAGYDATIHCYTDDFCFIDCSNNGCNGTYVVCYGTCFVTCDETQGHACPYVYYPHASTTSTTLKPVGTSTTNTLLPLPTISNTPTFETTHQHPHSTGNRLETTHAHPHSTGGGTSNNRLNFTTTDSFCRENCPQCNGNTNGSHSHSHSNLIPFLIVIIIILIILLLIVLYVACICYKLHQRSTMKGQHRPSVSSDIAGADVITDVDELAFGERKGLNSNRERVSYSGNKRAKHIAAPSMSDIHDIGTLGTTSAMSMSPTEAQMSVNEAAGGRKESTGSGSGSSVFMDPKQMDNKKSEKASGAESASPNEIESLINGQTNFQMKGEMDHVHRNSVRSHQHDGDSDISSVNEEAIAGIYEKVERVETPAKSNHGDDENEKAKFDV